MLGHIEWPDNIDVWFVDLSQRKFSLFVVFSYFFYVGIPALVTIRVLERH